MKIYLHIGTEKTGSSHLQSIAAINRKQLKDQGVWFPEAGKRDQQMVKGEISAGNAQNITDAINENDFAACNEIIKEHLQKAREFGCHSLFLSNELLVLAFAEENNLKKLQAVFKNNDCTEVKYLLFLRDPVDQALSLYKHRAKSGKTADIEQWPEKHYLYGTGLLNFLKNAEQEEADLACRKFSKKEGVLENILFKEWLGLDIELIPPPKLVNPSLSLSELLLIKKMRKFQPELANILYERLIVVSKDHKAEDGSIDQYHRDLLSNHLTLYEQTWDMCNAHLPEAENLVYPSKIDGVDQTSGKISSFSELQMDEISNIIAESLSFRFKLRVEGLKWRRRIGRFKMRLFK